MSIYICLVPTVMPVSQSPQNRRALPQSDEIVYIPQRSLSPVLRSSPL